jgi:hypothetical protein
MGGGTCEKGAPTDRGGMPMEKKGAPINAPTNGQVLQRMAREHLGKKKAGIGRIEPASRRTPASHERCERERGRKKEDSVVREVRSR